MGILIILVIMLNYIKYKTSFVFLNKRMSGLVLMKGPYWWDCA